MPEPGAVTEVDASPTGDVTELDPRTASPSDVPTVTRPGLRPGTVIGRHVLGEELGAGGMGRVFAAHDSALDRDVAIKFVRLDRGARVDRFLREARATARCAHPQIVVVHEIAEHEGLPYMVMERLAGTPLSALVAAGPVPVARVIRIMTAVARALAHAHAHGLVHRDLKPANIVVQADDSAKVVDFGIAALAGTVHDDIAHDPARHEISGTLPYMAPEQLAGNEVDARADLWAFGVVCFELLTGRRPFLVRDPASFAAELQDLDRPAPGVGPGVPPALAALIESCLEKRVSRRCRSASDLVTALEGMVGGGTRRRFLPIVGASVALAMIGVVAIGVRGSAPAGGLDAAELVSLTQLDRELLARWELGDHAGADALFDGFLERAPADELRARAWLDRATRERALAAPRAARRSFARAYLAGGSATSSTRALAGIATLALEGADWPTLVALAPQVGHGSPWPRALTERLAFAFREPPALDGDPAIAAVGRTLLRGTPLSVQAETAEVRDLDGDGRDEVLLVTATGIEAWSVAGPPRRRWTMPIAQSVLASCSAREPDGGALLVVAGRDRSRAFRVDGDGARSVGTFAPAARCAITDLDGDGALEVYLTQDRDLTVTTRDASGTWNARSYPNDSFLTALSAGDLDGDGRAELVVAAAEWQHYDIRVLRADRTGLVVVDRARLGQIGALRLGEVDARGHRAIHAYKRATYPRAVAMPAAWPTGAPDGVYRLGFVDERLVFEAYTPLAAPRPHGRLELADLDGDGDDEVVFVALDGLATSRVLDDPERLEAIGVRVLAKIELDGDPADELVAVLDDDAAPRVYLLGHGDTPVPARTRPRARAPLGPPPGGLPASSKPRWARAATIVKLGDERGFEILGQLAATSPPAAQASALRAVLDARRTAGLPLGETADELARRTPSERAAAAWFEATRIHVEELDPAAARAVGAPHAEMGPVVTLYDGGGIPETWRLEDPIAVRRDPVGRALRLDVMAPGPLWHVPLTATHALIELHAKLTWRRAEWAAGVGFRLGPAGGPPVLDLAVRTTGGSGSYEHSIDVTASAGTAREAFQPHDRVEVGIPVVVDIVIDRVRGRLRYRVQIGSVVRDAQLDIGVQTATSWELAVHAANEPGAWTRAVFELSHLEVGGLVLDTAPDRDPVRAAIRALAEGETLNAPPVGTDRRLPAIAAANLLRGGRGDLARALAKLATDDLGMLQITHLMRQDDGAFSDRIREALGAEGDAYARMTWATPSLYHGDDEVARRELVERTHDAAFDLTSELDRGVFVMRARARADLGDRAGARRDLEQLRAHRPRDSMEMTTLVSLAELRAGDGDLDGARAALETALEHASAQEVVADGVLASPVLEAATSRPDWEPIRRRLRPLMLPPGAVPASRAARLLAECCDADATMRAGVRTR